CCAEGRRPSLRCRDEGVVAIGDRCRSWLSQCSKPLGVFGLTLLRNALSQARKKEGPMIPAAFDYHRPGSLEEAVGLLARHGDQAKVLSGGMSLLPLLKLR